MLVYRSGWERQKPFYPASLNAPRTPISVIIPARNEAANIGACVSSIVAQDYPAELIELIVVDDHSEDNTAAIAQAAGQDIVKVVSLKDLLTDADAVNAYKKRALGAGIKASSGTLIVTTDADCIAPPNWLRLLAACQEQYGAAMIIGPVAYSSSSSLLDVFQSLDFSTMQGITAASHALRLGGMANGANLAFTRAAFDAVDGYSGTEHLASGDDYLLLNKMQQAFPEQIAYLKSPDAIVTTTPQPDWSSFLQQRVRWASKSGKYSDHRLTSILMMVYAFNVAFLVLAIAGFWDARLWLAGAAMLVIKTVFELILLYPVARFFGKQRELSLFPLLQPLHIMYIIMAGFLGMRGGYQWKGRRVK